MNNQVLTEAEIWAGIIRADRQDMSVSEANAVLQWTLAPEARRKMEELALRNNLGELTQGERDELEAFVNVGQVIAILQAKARLSLRSSGAK